MTIDPILEWSKVSASIELARREAKERVLKEFGISEDALKELKSVVMTELEKRRGKVIDNEYGQIRGKWSVSKDREGNTKDLGCVHCFIIPRTK